MPMALQKIIAEWRVETSFKEITDQMERARHGAHTFWGLLTRAAATPAAHVLPRACLAGLIDAQINSHDTPQPVAQPQIGDLEPRRAACLVLGAGSAASLASWAAGRPDRQCVAGVWQPLSGCPVAASRRARALREHCGRDGSPPAGSSSGETAVRPASSTGRICMADGDHPGARGLAPTRLRARAGGQLRAGPFRRAAVRGACPP
jgi:hypothetical protein